MLSLISFTLQPSSTKPPATHEDMQLQLRTPPENEGVEEVMLELGLIL